MTTMIMMFRIVLMCVFLHGLSDSKDVVVVAEGFAWAENIVCAIKDSNTAALFVSENKRGEIWKVTWNGTAYDQERLGLSDDFNLFAGLAKNDSEIFALGNPKGGGKCQLIRIDGSWSGDTYDVIATLPRKCLGSGLAYNNGVFYAASEGDFVPFEGAIYRIDNSGNVVSVKDRGFADDGVAIDTQRDLVYVSEAESISHKVLVLNSTSGAYIDVIQPENVDMIDDFTVDISTGRVVAADFLGGKIVRFDGWTRSKKPKAEVLLSAITSPTSARFGCVHDGSLVGLSDKLIFVSEGGGLLSSTHNRRVLAFHPSDDG